MADGINLTALAAPTALLPPTDTSGVIISGVNLNQHRTSKHTLSGALTADTYKEMISLSIPGLLRLCGVYSIDGTARTLGLKIVIDGTTVIDAVSAALSAANAGWMAVGINHELDNMGLESGIRFNASLSISIKSSISETDKIALVHLTAV